MKPGIYLFALFFACSITGVTAQVNYKDILKEECDFILDHQLNDGAFTMSGGTGNTKYKICPYFNNIAAIALLEVPSQSNIAAVKRWMVWYMEHLNEDGSIDDYYASNYTGEAKLQKTGDFDSIDSYAATFFTLARKLCEVSVQDRTWLRKYSVQLDRIGKALALVIDDKGHLYNGFSKDNDNGLSVAKPKYKAKYTMDNAEVNLGMRDVIWLAKRVLPVLDAQFWKTALKSNTYAFEKYLWNAENSRYFMYEGGPKANWEKFYADATCQLYPIWCKVINRRSARAKGLWATFNTFYPGWSSGKTYGKGKFPWTVILYTAAVMKDKARVSSYLEYVKTYTVNGRQPDNWYNMEAAFVILAIKEIN